MAKWALSLQLQKASKSRSSQLPLSIRTRGLARSLHLPTLQRHSEVSDYIREIRSWYPAYSLLKSCSRVLDAYLNQPSADSIWHATATSSSALELRTQNSEGGFKPTVARRALSPRGTEKGTVESKPTPTVVNLRSWMFFVVSMCTSEAALALYIEPVSLISQASFSSARETIVLISAAQGS